MKWTDDMGSILGQGDNGPEDTARLAFFVILGWLEANRMHRPSYELRDANARIPDGFSGSSSLGEVALLGTVQGWLVGSQKRMTAGAFVRTFELALRARKAGFSAFRKQMRAEHAEAIATKYRCN